MEKVNNVISMKEVKNKTEINEKVDKIFRIEQQRIETREVYIKVNVDKDFTEEDLDISHYSGTDRGDDLLDHMNSEWDGGWEDQFLLEEESYDRIQSYRKNGWSKEIYDCSIREDDVGENGGKILKYERILN